MAILGNPRHPISQVLSVWRSLTIILAPVILLFIPFIIDGKDAIAGRCAYVIALMAVYWMTEAIPIAATALLPVALMPPLGVMKSKDLCKNYLKDTNMLFVGGLLVAVAVERWNLHKRIALGVLLFVGSKPKWLLFGFMATTAFLSMWLSNTATTAMMIPIAQAVLSELDNHRKSQRLKPTADANNYQQLEGQLSRGHSLMTMETSLETINTCHLDVPQKKKHLAVAASEAAEKGSTVPDDDKSMVGHASPKKDPNGKTSGEPTRMDRDFAGSMEFPAEILTDDQVREDEAFASVTKGLTLSIAYAANIGGTATLTGTGPNLILKGQVDTLYGSDSGLNFGSWFIFAFPNMCLTLFLAWVWLQALYLGPRELFSFCLRKGVVHDDTANKVIRREYVKLGAWSFAEISTLCFFFLLALLWLTREPGFMPGWSALFMEKYVTDASCAITIGMMLFMFPSTRPNILCFRSRGEPSEPGPVPALLDWPIVHEKLPWNVIIVLGGGFALADACKNSGLSVLIGNAFTHLGHVQPWCLVLILCVVTAVFTEVASNTATATIFLPVLAELAVALHINPLYLMMPVTIATSLAFMLPVATPPNAMVFAYGTMKIVDMAKAGCLMNLLSILALTVAINSWGFAYFDLGTFPHWADADAKAITESMMNITQAAVTQPFTG